MTAKRSLSILEGVDAIIEQWLGIAKKPKYGKRPLNSKRALIDLSERKDLTPGPAQARASELIAKLFSRIEENYKASGGASPSPSNWQWEKSLKIDFDHTSEEKSLEKIVVQVLGDDWVNQVSVCNAMAKRKEYCRRIDLAHRLTDHEFELIELKYGTEVQGHGSDTPLFAAMEIVQYALVYLFCRVRRLYGRQLGKGNLLSAKAIHLIVLAPTGYYSYEKQGQMRPYGLGWLEDCLNDGLCHYLQRCHDKLPTMDFHFQVLSPEFDQVYRPLKTAIDAFRRTGISMRRGLCS